MPESFVQPTYSLGEAQIVEEALLAAEQDDLAADLRDLIEDGPYLSAEQERGATAPGVRTNETEANDA